MYIHFLVYPFRGTRSSGTPVSVVPDLGFFIYIILLFIYFGCAGSSLLLRLFSSCGGGLLFIAVHGFLIAVVSLVAEHRL